MSLLFPAKWLRQLCSREAGSVSSRRSPFHCLQFYCRLPAAPRPSDLASPRDAPALPVTVAWSNTNTNHALATPFTHALPQQHPRSTPRPMDRVPRCTDHHRSPNPSCLSIPRNEKDRIDFSDGMNRRNTMLCTYSYGTLHRHSIVYTSRPISSPEIHSTDTSL